MIGFLIGWYVFNAIATVALIGRKRDPITPSVAAVSVLIYALFVYGLVNWV